MPSWLALAVTGALAAKDLALDPTRSARSSKHSTGAVIGDHDRRSGDRQPRASSG